MPTHSDHTPTTHCTLALLINLCTQSPMHVINLYRLPLYSTHTQNDSPMLKSGYKAKTPFYCIQVHCLPQDSSDGEEVESVPDDVSIAESHEDYSLFVPTPSNQSSVGGHWALPHTRPTFHNSSRLSRSGNSSRWVWLSGLQVH